MKPRKNSERQLNPLPPRAGCAVLDGDCLDVLAALPEESVHLVVTSPPYADKRRSTYGGVHPDDYVDWFIPRASAIRRVLRDDGTFILNIKENVVNGERHTYVLELIQAMRSAGVVVDRRIRLAQEKQLPRQVAEPVPGLMGAATSVQQATPVRYVPGGSDGTRG